MITWLAHLYLDALVAGQAAAKAFYGAARLQDAEVTASNRTVRLRSSKLSHGVNPTSHYSTDLRRLERALAASDRRGPSIASHRRPQLGHGAIFSVPDRGPIGALCNSFVGDRSQFVDLDLQVFDFGSQRLT
jgi:hypothetical protein